MLKISASILWILRNHWCSTSLLTKRILIYLHFMLGCEYVNDTHCECLIFLSLNEMPMLHPTRALPVLRQLRSNSKSCTVEVWWPSISLLYDQPWRDAWIYFSSRMNQKRYIIFLILVWQVATGSTGTNSNFQNSSYIYSSARYNKIVAP